MHKAIQKFKTLRASNQTLRNIVTAASESRFKSKLIYAGFSDGDQILYSYDVLYSDTNEWLECFTCGNLIFSFDQSRSLEIDMSD